MRTVGCGHAEYSNGHCGFEGCANDYFACADCCPATQRRGGGQGWAGAARRDDQDRSEQESGR